MTVAAIAGTRRAMRELVDGTIRVQVDIDPQFRRAFLEMFPEIDTPVALAPLVPEHAREPEPGRGDSTQPPQDQRRPDGNAATPAPILVSSAWKNLGPLAQSAVLMCKELIFLQYVAEMCSLDVGEMTEKGAATYIKHQCQIASRKDLDTTDGARSRYGALMAHFREWQR